MSKYHTKGQRPGKSSPSKCISSTTTSLAVSQRVDPWPNQTQSRLPNIAKSSFVNASCWERHNPDISKKCVILLIHSSDFRGTFLPHMVPQFLEKSVSKTHDQSEPSSSKRFKRVLPFSIVQTATSAPVCHLTNTSERKRVSHVTVTCPAGSQSESVELRKALPI